MALDDATPRQGRFLDVPCDNVVVTHVKPAEEGGGTVVRLINLGDRPANARVALPGRDVTAAWQCGTLEDKRSELALAAGSAVCELPPRQITTVLLFSR